MFNTLILSITHFSVNIRKWSRPATGVLAVGSLSDLKRNRRDLVIENAMLLPQHYCKFITPKPRI